MFDINDINSLIYIHLRCFGWFICSLVFFLCGFYLHKCVINLICRNEKSIYFPFIYYILLFWCINLLLNVSFACRLFYAICLAIKIIFGTDLQKKFLNSKIFFQKGQKQKKIIAIIKYLK